MSEITMFDSARQKLEWAEKHIANFQAVFAAFIERKPYTFGAKEKPASSTKMATIRFTEKIPADLSMVMGDVIHNLRAALDHAMWELMGRDGGQQNRHTTLPTGDARQSYEGTCGGIKTPRSDTRVFLASLEAFKNGGGHDLYAIHRLDIADKHQIILPIVRQCQPPIVQLTRPDGSEMWAMGSPVFKGERGGAVGWKDVAPENSVQFRQDSEPTFEVIFGDVEFFPGEPIVPTLLHLANVVRETIGKFERFVMTRTP